MCKLQKILQHKKTINAIMIFLLVVMLMEVAYSATYNIIDVPSEVRKYLEVNDFFNMMARPIGGFIHSVLAMLLGYVEDSFLKLASFDIFSLEPIQKFDMNMKSVIKVLIPLALIVCLIIRVFKVQNPFKVLTNALSSMLMIGVFVTFMGLGFELKNALIKDIDSAMGKKDNEHISDVLLKSNTVDLKQSIKKHSVVYLSDQKDIEIDKIDLNQVLDKDFLETKYTYEDGKLETEELSDGVLGLFEEYYYKYKTDYFALNITEICSLVVYVLAIYKLAYLSGEWLKIKLTGTYFMLKGFHNLDNNGKIYGAGMKNLLAIVLLYFGMTFYTIVSSALMQTELLDNWLLKAVVILAIGMSLVVGSGFFNEINGIDDGSGFMMKSMFAGNRLARMGKGMIKSGSNALGMLSSGANAVGNVGTNIANGINDSLANHERRRINEDMNDWYKENQTKYLTDDGTILGGFTPTPDEPHQYGMNADESGTNVQSYSNDSSGYDEKQLQENLAKLKGTNIVNQNKESDYNMRNSNNSMEDLRENLNTNGLHLNNGQIASAYNEYRNGKTFDDIKNDYASMKDSQNFTGVTYSNVHNSNIGNNKTIGRRVESNMNNNDNENANKGSQKEINDLKSNSSNNESKDNRFVGKTYSNIHNTTIGNNNTMNGIGSMKDVRIIDDENPRDTYEDLHNVIIGNNNVVDGTKQGGKK